MTSTPLELFRIYDRPFDWKGQDGYPRAWHDTIKHLVRAQAQNRCIRCGHPYTRGAGEWSPCDPLCTHFGEIRYRDSALQDDWRTAELDKYGQTAGQAIYDFVQGHTARRWDVEARWRILTVHHLNEVKIDNRWWNLAALCQRCHLTIQGKVKLEREFIREHTAWFKPYAAGWYAFKYEGANLTREQAVARQDELLAHELSELPLFNEED